MADFAIKNNIYAIFKNFFTIIIVFTMFTPQMSFYYIIFVNKFHLTLFRINYLHFSCHDLTLVKLFNII